MSTGSRRRRATEAEAFDGSTLRTVLVALVVVKVVGLILLVDPRAAEAFEVPKSLFSRATEWLIAAVLVVAMVRHGTRIIRLTYLHLWVVLVVAVTALATATAESSFLGIYGELDRRLGLAQVVDMGILAVAVGAGFRRPLDWARLAIGVSAGLGGGVGYAVAQRLGVDPIGWSNDTRTTTFSTFGNVGSFAAFLVVAVAAACAVAITYRRSPLPTALAVLTGIAGGAVLPLLAVRSVFLGAAGALVVLAAVVIRRGIGRRTATLGGALCVVAAALLVAILIATPLGSRTLATLTGGGLEERAAIYRGAIAATVARPLLGWGPDNVGVYEPGFHTAADERNGLVYDVVYKNNSAHSWVLQATATTGLLGLAALLALMATTVRALWRSLDRDRPLAFTLLTAYATYWVSSLTAVGSVSSAWIPWVITGGAMTLIGSSPNRDAPSAGRAASIPPALQRYATVGVLAVALVGAVSGRAALDASHAMHDFRGAIREPRDPRAALLFAQRAVAADPGRFQYWDALGFALFATARYTESSAAYEEVVRRAPHDPEGWVSLAQSYSQRALRSEPGDNRGRALAAAERAVAAAPNRSLTRAARSTLSRELGEYDLAFREAIAAIELRTTAEFDTLALEAASGVTDPPVAARVLERLIAERDSAPLRIALARVDLILRDLDAVRRHARRALELDPGSALATSLLRQVGE